MGGSAYPGMAMEGLVENNIPHENGYWFTIATTYLAIKILLIYQAHNHDKIPLIAYTTSATVFTKNQWKSWEMLACLLKIA